MVHRDVKSANVLLQRDDEGRVVRAILANFGLALFHLDLNESGPGSGLAASSMTAVVGTHGCVESFVCGGTVYFQHVPTDAVFINYFSITIVEFNLQTGRPSA
jgi:hypothetical protein